MTGGTQRRPSTDSIHPAVPMARAVAAVLAVALLIAACADAGASAAPVLSPGQAATSPADATGSPGAATSPSPAGDGPGTTSAPATPPADAEWARVQPTDLRPVATLEPVRTVPAGVLPDSGFRLASLTGADAVTLAAGLRAEPAVRFSVARQDDGTALVTPASPLHSGTSYRFSLTAPDGTVQQTWPVETVGGLWVVASVPDQETEGVPVSTGIEFTFSQDGVSAADVERFFEIDPATPGHFEQDGRTVAFVPTDPLRAATRYRAQLRDGMPLAGTSVTLDGQYVIDFTTAGFAAPKVYVSFDQQLVESPTADAPVLSVYLDRDDEAQPLAVLPTTLGLTVHRLPGLDGAVDAWRTLARDGWATRVTDPAVDIAGLPLVLEATVPLRPFATGRTPDPDDDESDDEGGDASAWIRLPTSLPAGWYVVTSQAPGQASQVILQVTDVAVYVATSTTTSVVWANDIATRGPLAGAQVAYDGAPVGRTGPDGLLQTPLERPRGEVELWELPAVVVRDGDRAAFTVDTGAACEKCDVATADAGPWSSAWRVLELDRTRYRPTDTITGWGVIRARGTRAVPDTVTLRVLVSDDDGVSVPAATTTVKPDTRGMFHVRLPIAALPDGGYTLDVLVGETAVGSQYFGVGEILKPAWSMTVTTGTHAVLAGSSLRVGIQARFYEGTPVTGTRVKVREEGKSRTVTTGITGDASVKVPIARRTAEEADTEWWISSISAEAVEPEEGWITASTPVAVFTSEVLPQVRAVGTASTLSVAGSVHRVAWSRFDAAGEEEMWNVDPFGAPVPGAKVVVRLKQHLYTTVRDGTAYDFISKQAVPVYRSVETVKDLGTRTLRTDRRGRFSFTVPTAGATDGYEVIVTAYDAKGRATRTSTWGEIPDATSNRGVTPHLVGPGSQESPAQLSVGEQATVTFAGIRPTRASRYLWTVAQSGIQTAAITTKPRLQVTFQETWVPAAWVDAVRFTGTGYQDPADPLRLEFDAADRRLAVSVATDKARYAPGDTATVTVRVRNAAGKGVAASVYLRGIDEKLFAIGAAGVEDPILALYDDPGSGILAEGWTHASPTSRGGAGGADTTGGGGDEPRTDFRDWLVSTVLHTDPNGRAQASFPVSDDLTSWRIVAQAVSSALGAGTGIVRMPVSVPFFAEATVAPSYLATDRPVLAARAFGGGMTDSSTVTFRFSSDTLSMAPVTVTAKAFRPAEVALPPLTPGGHSVRIEASTGRGGSVQRDVVVRTFDVVGPRAVQEVVRSAALNGSMPIGNGQGLTYLMLSDAGRGRVVPVLQDVADGMTTRGDGAFAARLARRVLSDTFGVASDGQQPEVRGFCRDDGVAVVPWGSGTVELAALSAMARDPDGCDMTVLDGSPGEDSGEGAAPRDRETQLWALAGRAALGSSVLEELRTWAAAPDLSVTEQAIVAMGLIAAGDDDAARGIEQRLVGEHGRRWGPWVRIEGGGSQGDALLTARVAVVAASLGDPLAADMDAYVSASPPTGTLLALERALAAAAWARRMPPGTASAAITVDGTRQVVQVTGGRPATVRLTPSQAASASVEPVSGSVLMTTRTRVPVSASSLTPVPDLAITRSVSPKHPGAGGRIRVTLKVTAPALPSDDCWMVTETVPSGMRPIMAMDGYDEDGGDDSESATDTPWSVDGQRITWCVTRPSATKATAVLTYLARVLTPGTYTWEPAVVQAATAPDHGTVLPITTIAIKGLARR